MRKKIESFLDWLEMNAVGIAILLFLIITILLSTGVIYRFFIK